MKSLLKKKNIVLILVIIILVITIYIIYTNILYPVNISGKLVEYKTLDEFWGMYSKRIFYDELNNWSMTKEEADYICSNQDSYTGYVISYKIQNISDHTIYYLKSELDKHNNNLWYDNSSLGEGEVILKAGESINDSFMLILIKMENMTGAEIDQLIKSIGITISARNYGWLPIYASKTIYFEE